MPCCTSPLTCGSILSSVGISPPRLGRAGFEWLEPLACTCGSILTMTERRERGMEETQSQAMLMVILMFSDVCASACLSRQQLRPSRAYRGTVAVVSLTRARIGAVVSAKRCKGDGGQHGLGVDGKSRKEGGSEGDREAHRRGREQREHARILWPPRMAFRLSRLGRQDGREDWSEEVAHRLRARMPQAREAEEPTG